MSERIEYRVVTGGGKEEYERQLRSMPLDDLMREVAMNTMGIRMATMSLLFHLQDMTSDGPDRQIVNVYDHGRDELPN